MTRRNAARALAILAGASIVLAACGQAATPTSAPGGSQAAVITPIPTTQPPGATEGPAFSFVLPNEDKDLEALLPDQIGGATTTKLSMAGDSFLMAGGAGSAGFTAILSQFGKSPSDLSVAAGSTTDIQLFAFRVKGVDANQLFQAFVQKIGSAQGDVVSDATVGGKSVKKSVSVAGDVTYVYASGDVLFTLDADADVAPALVNEAFSKLR